MSHALAAAFAVALAGCTVIEHVQVLPIINPNTYDVSCCVAYAEIPPSTQLNLSITHSDAAGTKVKLGARWRF
ncbi:hypothetical protein [Paraburkholderia caballeronis]|uniref:Uncharacterized protein n=1 Tax=Paraburkholderia caballeronis TaxID=416943 RepID=A0A1H7TZ74_9BURK|nr:hypothetical protein [Paraburkholderia caballeronis]PXW23426.1 hypothetical protein C7403_110164 [Paraburkholderia caballeronis]PXW98419.1 hypothetical protein C7407_110164 [Paraburkholderia caballeronis]RAJ95150.1 hypothetical protein C7409_110165 [Paraburkholderia caballeronis]SEC54131.1 hypothetical protein SAMN05445871_2396 [Paraburkholderia caballeronis]SEL90172.1 hypothetical protein SAMN05192542_11754 [Paraburkholderia caballeronis]